MEEKQACAAREVIVSKADLPLSCPQDGQKIFAAHPKVYLPIEKHGSITCPYCSTHYVLETLNENTDA